MAAVVRPSYDARSEQSGRFGRRRWLQRAAAAGAGLAGAGLVACSSRGGTSGVASRAAPEAGGQPQTGGTYSVNLATNPALDPQQRSDQGVHRAASAVLSRLFRFKTGADPSVIDN